VGASFGFRVSTAGDVNGDGYSDVIIGAPYYDHGQVDEGAAFVYHGSAMGLGMSPAWSAESNQGGAEMGFPVATAGDVDGDGYSDVLVSAWKYTSGHLEEGRVFFYHGSPNGLLPVHSWSTESNQNIGEYGFSIANAGDVNGDGFSDILVGAPGYENGEWNEGRVWFYYGNDSEGPHRIPRMARADDQAPIWLHGAAGSPESFRLKALGRNPAGRGKVRLQWEVKPFDVPFDGTGLGLSPAFDTGPPPDAAVSFNELVTGLEADNLYRWRMRVVTDSPFFPRSRWLWLPYNAVTETDLRTSTGVEAIAEQHSVPGLLRLGPGAPNPFHPATELRYILPTDGRARLRVFDVSGRQVAVLVDEMQTAGSHVARWDGRDGRGGALPAGTYFARLELAGEVTSRKIVLIK
jgi:hypothetical protein